jgi:hypothetical protein
MPTTPHPRYPSHRPEAARPLLAPVLAVLLSLAVALLLGACTGKDKGNGQPGGKASGPLASVRGDIPGLVVGGGSLERDGGNVVLRFTITNQTSNNVTIGDLLGKQGTANSNDTGGVSLYDGNARKRYVPSDQTPTTVPIGLDPGKSVELSTTFPGVPDGAGEMSALIPHFAPLDGLKVQS